jgi:hypothetical protein
VVKPTRFEAHPPENEYSRENVLAFLLSNFRFSVFLTLFSFRLDMGKGHKHAASRAEDLGVYRRYKRLIDRLIDSKVIF